MLKRIFFALCAALWLLLQLVVVSSPAAAQTATQDIIFAAGAGNSGQAANVKFVVTDANQVVRIAATQTLSITGTTNATTTVSAVSSFAGLIIGQGISGSGIPTGATIAALNPGASQLTLSVAATTSVSGAALTVNASVEEADGSGAVTTGLYRANITTNNTWAYPLTIRFAIVGQAGVAGASFINIPLVGGKIAATLNATDVTGKVPATMGAGDGADAATALTRLGTPAGASVSADLAAVKTDTNNTLTKIGTPAGASVSADVAAVKSDTNTTNTRVTVTRAANLDFLTAAPPNAVTIRQEIDSNSTQLGAIVTATNAVKVTTDKLSNMITGSSPNEKFTTNALSNGAGGGSGSDSLLNLLSAYTTSGTVGNWMRLVASATDSSGRVTVIPSTFPTNFASMLISSGGLVQLDLTQALPSSTTDTVGTALRGSLTQTGQWIVDGTPGVAGSGTSGANPTLKQYSPAGTLIKTFDLTTPQKRL